MPRVLFQSPTGLVHMAKTFGDRAKTFCGREVDMDSWTNVGEVPVMTGMPDAAKIELPTCDRCWRRSKT